MKNRYLFILLAVGLLTLLQLFKSFNQFDGEEGLNQAELIDQPQISHLSKEETVVPSDHGIQNKIMQEGELSALNPEHLKNSSSDKDPEPEPLLSSYANTSSSKTAWCILDKKSTSKFFHFPHALQTLSLCWSWFQTQKEATDKCGLYFREKIGGFSGERDWRQNLLKVMGCQYTYLKPPESDLFYHPPKKEVNERRYFWKPEDAAALRARLLSISANQISPSALHIGLVDRKKTRRILNIDTIEASIRKEYPTAVLEMTTMEALSPIEQFRFWSRQDLVVIGHGAGMASMIFLKHNSSIVEIFPPHYYLKGFWKLGKSMGVRNYGYFNNVTDPEADHKENTRYFAQRVANRAVDLEPPMEAIMDLVRQAVSEGPSTR
eukprot:CAMPEP_0198149604 /NCGR_PEP_ID=MMETSP1443-20131203/47351_1 /TAXON_ID=186043 /ORGANISM="Entomoneis sp., Strain CCMP2396" /LENGTH=377 /DNA_ID=CAMNT_0043814691 /DNA_START=74 /DNA_END=1207 /DNA_ORIENTATION=+